MKILSKFSIVIIVVTLTFVLLFLPKNIDRHTESNEVKYNNANYYRNTVVAPALAQSIHNSKDIPTPVYKVGRRSVSVVIPADYEALIKEAADKYGADIDWMRRVMYCESRGDRLAKNKYSSASGLYQFLTSTWKTTPYASQSIWDPKAQIYAAAWMYSVGRAREWSCK